MGDVVAFEEEEALQVEVVDLFAVNGVGGEAGVELVAVEPFDAGAVPLEGVQDAALGAEAFAEEVEQDSALSAGVPHTRRDPVHGPGRVMFRLNAVSEAFNSVLKVEYVHRHTFRTRTEARIRI
ncbi:hypothetical protein ABZZ74_54105, partial [Streptomyces sp. NPDC006476]|uniref:hypothetical protein n=1 Tax=Streptomyces sp. NPDC006476 TaxID=3157175 RepID=UPI0033BA8F68